MIARPSPTRWQLPEHVLWETLQHESVLLDLESGLYYSLNETGTAMLAALAAGASLDEVAARLAPGYVVSEDTLRRDAAQLVEQLSALGILVPRPGSEPTR